MNRITKRLSIMLIAAVLVMSFCVASVSAKTHYDDVTLKPHMSKSSITVRKGDKIVLYVIEKGELVKPYKVRTCIHKGWIASMKKRSRSFKITAKRTGQTFIYFYHNGRSARLRVKVKEAGRHSHSCTCDRYRWW